MRCTEQAPLPAVELAIEVREHPTLSNAYNWTAIASPRTLTLKRAIGEELRDQKAIVL
jgi:hypothetical protein